MSDDLRTYPVIGSKYQGPDLDRQCLRQLPIGWKLEGARTDYRPCWWKRVEVWVIIIVALWLLAGAAQVGGIGV